jgi:hypothetical protein
MSALLAKLARSKALGLYIDDREVALTLAASTPLGPIEITRRSEPYAPDELHLVLRRLVSPYLDRRGRCKLPVALGLPPARVFFSTRAIRTPKSEASPHILLQEALQSRDLTSEEMAVDVIHAKPDKRHVASIAACRRSYLTGLLRNLEFAGIRPPRAEPGPWALLRVAERRLRAPRPGAVVVRLFLGADTGLAVVTANRFPVLWRCFAFSAGQELSAIRAVSRALQPLISYCGVDAPVDALLVHGQNWPAGLRHRLTAETGLPVLCCDEPRCDGGDIAFGLALGRLGKSAEGFDLARPFQLPPDLGAIFPWREAVLHAAVLLGMGAFLHLRNADLADELHRVHTETSRLGVSSMVLTDLENEKKNLVRKLAAVRGFASGRIPWSSYTDVVAARVPADVALSSFQGLCQDEPGKQKGSKKKSFILQAAAPLADNDSVPEEIQNFVDSLRRDPSLTREFPLIELADIKTGRSEDHPRPVANFTVMCLGKASAPDTKGAGPSAGGTP